MTSLYVCVNIWVDSSVKGTLVRIIHKMQQESVNQTSNAWLDQITINFDQMWPDPKHFITQQQVRTDEGALWIIKSAILVFKDS